MWDDIKRLYEVSCSYLYSTDLLKRLRSGPIFRDIVDRMKLVVGGQADRREKFYAFSAHDTSVAQTLTAFGVNLHRFPVYASLVLIELHEVNGEHEVRVSGICCPTLCDIDAISALLQERDGQAGPVRAGDSWMRQTLQPESLGSGTSGGTSTELGRGMRPLPVVSIQHRNLPM